MTLNFRSCCQWYPQSVYRGQKRGIWPIFPLIWYQQTSAWLSAQQSPGKCSQNCKSITFLRLRIIYFRFPSSPLQVDGRLNVSLTKVYDGANLLASHFSSKHEVIDVTIPLSNFNFKRKETIWVGKQWELSQTCCNKRLSLHSVSGSLYLYVCVHYSGYPGISIYPGLFWLISPPLQRL